MTASLEISEGTILDLDEMMTVMEDSFDPAFGEAWTTAQCAGILPMAGVWLSICRLGPEPVGFALGRAVHDEAELLLLAVRRSAQRQQIGRQLLERFVSTAASRGAQRLHLEVREGNHAVKLYRSCGFTEAGRRRGYYSGRDGQVYDALTLARSVTI